MFILALAILAVSNAEAFNAGYCVPSTPIQPKESLSVEDAFIKANIVHDYIPVPPRDLIMGAFGETEIIPGMIMSPLQGLGLPTYFVYPNATEGDLYALFYLDIDSPSLQNPIERAKIHLLSVNLPGESLKKKSLNFGDIVVPYIPLSPALESGLHRYIGLCYKQQKRIDIDAPELVRLSRTLIGFSVVDFANQHGLGDPLAGNFFLTQFTTRSL